MNAREDMIRAARLIKFSGMVETRKCAIGKV
jgi:hypothetical protein